jgi:hypothetical protein
MRIPLSERGHAAKRTRPSVVTADLMQLLHGRQADTILGTPPIEEPSPAGGLILHARFAPGLSWWRRLDRHT